MRFAVYYLFNSDSKSIVFSPSFQLQGHNSSVCNASKILKISLGFLPTFKSSSRSDFEITQKNRKIAIFEPIFGPKL